MYQILTAVETVKVPQMAESLTEGTLKTWTKKVGDHVEADEEVATIETDKVPSHPSHPLPSHPTYPFTPRSTCQ